MKKITSLFLGLFILYLFAPRVFAQQQDTKQLQKGQLIEVPNRGQGQTQTAAKANEQTLSQESVLFEEDFEAEASAWSASGAWAIGQPTGGPGQGYNSVNTAATNLNGNYPDNTESYLVSPSISIPSINEQIILQFEEWFEIESGYDYGYIEISTDNGASWRTLRSRSGASNWRTSEIDLSSYAGETIRLRFRLETDESDAFAGWHIDNVRMATQSQQPISLQITGLNSQNFPNIYANVRVDTNGAGFPNLTQEDFTVFENGTQQTELFNVTPPEEGGGVRRADVIFLMDNSGSMGGEQDDVQANVFDFVDNLSASDVDYALGLARYGASQNNGGPVIEDGGSLTSDADYFKNDVWMRNVTSGGTEPGYFTITESAGNFNFRPGAQRIFIIITDERPDQGGASQNDALSALQNGDITLFALTESSHYDDFQPLTDATGGQLFDIYSSFNDILDFIAAQVADTYVVSYKSSNPDFDGTTRNVRIQAVHEGNTASDEASYVPGASPSIQRTEETVTLTNEAQPEKLALTIEARITDDVAPGVQQAQLFYKQTPDPESAYTSVQMTNTSGNIYQANIPANAVLTPGMDYYITATDGNTTSSSPSTNPGANPFDIAILPNNKPEITHTPVTQAPESQPVEIAFSATDNTRELERVKLYYRRTGQLSYEVNIHDNFVNQSDFLLTIPAEFVTTDGVEYYIEAEDDWGSDRTKPIANAADEPYRIEIGPIVNIELTLPENGPQSTTIDIPQNGSGYIHYKVTSKEDKIFHKKNFTVKLTDNSNTYNTKVKLLKDDLVQIQIPHSIFGNRSSSSLQITDAFSVGDTTYSLNEKIKFTARLVDQSYTRTWSIFAEGTLGGNLQGGGIGLGASAAAAKASISGTGGVGMDVKINQNDDISLTRKFDANFSTSIDIPSVNPVVGEVNAGIEGDFGIKTMLGQTISFSHLNISENIKKMAQAGYLLETLSLGGAPLSPHVLLVIRGINEFGNVSQYFNSAINSRYGGIGLEGSIGASVGASIPTGPIKFDLTAAEASTGFVMNGYYYNYPSGRNLELEKSYRKRFLTNSNTANPVTSAFKLVFANKFDISALSWNVAFAGSNESNVRGNSLITKGSGSEISTAAFWDNSGNLQQLEFSLSNGAEVDLFTSTRSNYETSLVQIPGEYISNLLNNDSVFSGFIEPDNHQIPFGVSVSKGLQNSFNTLSSNIENSSPLKLWNIENYGKGTEYNIKLSIDAVLGVGGGLELGLGFKVLDEIEYIGNYVEIYNGGKNYKVNSSNYDSSMEKADINNIIKDLLAGTIPLIKESLNNIISRISKEVEKGKDFVLDAIDKGSELIGTVRGKVEQAGRFIGTVFPLKSKRIVQKAFNKPEIKNRYSSTNVFHKVRPNKKATTQNLSRTGSKLIIISKAMEIDFIPSGQQKPISELSSPVELQMRVIEQDLLDSDFKVSDKKRVKLYRYNFDKNGWVLIGGNLSDNNLSENVTKMGIYALGIEINFEDDNTSPNILEVDYIDRTNSDETDEVYAIIRDDTYGSGLDFSQTHMILNGDTLTYTYQPSKGRFFYTLSEDEHLSSSVLGEVEIIATDHNGNRSSKSFKFQTDGTDNIDSLPEKFKLHKNYPNPATSETVIPFEVSQTTKIEINIYDVLGRFVATIFNQKVEPGPHGINWEIPSKLSSGVYFYQVRTPDYNQVKKLMIVK